MNIIDIIIVILIFLTALSGYRKGFILSLFSLLRLFLSIVIARALYPYAIDFLSQNFSAYDKIKNFLYSKIESISNGQSLISANTITDLIINLIIIIILYTIINIILSILIRFINGFFKLPILNTFNKFSGLIFGLAKGILIVFIIYVLLTPLIALNRDSFIAIQTANSLLGGFFYRPELFIDYLNSNYLYIMNLL